MAVTTGIPPKIEKTPDIQADFRALLDVVGLSPEDTGGSITFTGEDPILPSNHRLGAIMAMGMMGPAAATQAFYRLRGGEPQDLSIDLRDAVSFINPLYLFETAVSGFPLQLPFLEPGVNPLGFNIYPTKDDRWYLPTGAYPWEVAQWTGLLRCSLDKVGVTDAISQWNGEELESEAARRGMIGSLVRTPQEWYTHPQGEVLSQIPLVEIIKIGDSEPELPKLYNPKRPLSGVKVLSLTHVIAGPTTARTLAEQGAEVLHLAAPGFEYDGFVQDIYLGFRSIWSDLKQKSYRNKAFELVKDADVVVENFRGRRIADLGFSAEEAAQARPGIIYTSIRAFGWQGPWSERGGFDMDANCCSGYAVNEGAEGSPKLPPTIILNDFLAGYLTAMGVVAALILRAKHGGSYHVRTALTRFSMWYSQLGVFDPGYVRETIEREDHRPFKQKGIEINGAFGKQTHLGTGIVYSKTPGYWDIPGHPVVSPRGASEPVWLNY